MDESKHESAQPDRAYELHPLDSTDLGPLPPKDSFSSDLPDGDQADELRSYEVENARRLVEHAKSKMAAELRMHPSEQGIDTFNDEMSHEEQHTADNGLSYSVFRVNRDRPSDQNSQSRPVVLMLGLIGNADSGKGRDYVYEVASHNPGREIVVIQREGMGSSSKPDKRWLDNLDVIELGRNRLEVLDQMGIDEFDVIGYSFGAVAAVGLAHEAGPRAHALVTLGLPGYGEDNARSQLHVLKSIATDVAGSPGRVARELRKRAATGSTPQVEQPEDGKVAPLEVDAASKSIRERAAQALTVRGLGKMMLQTPQVHDALTHLSPSTHWTDVIGNDDHYIDWPDHVAKARDRNELSPHNSDVILLTDRASSHMDMSRQRALMAETAARALDRQYRREARQGNDNNEQTRTRP